jgi:cyclic pyranopterin phosphate synthase
MVDVGHKRSTRREAVAVATVELGPVAYGALSANAKGDVLSVARVAGIQAAKRTAELIPLCHPLLISHAAVDFTLHPSAHSLTVTASAACDGGTGVEMEAMTAASVAALTVYDMCKAASKGIVLRDVRLIRKSGGKSGEWRAEEVPASTQASTDPEARKAPFTAGGDV